MARPMPAMPTETAIRMAANGNAPGRAGLPSLASFGIAATPRPRLVRAAVDVGSMAEEFRSRIRDFVEGQHAPTGLSAFLGYLRDRMLGLETRRDSAGRDTNYLVDLTDRRSIAAFAVDPRLSVGGIKRTFGITPTEAADRRAADMSPERRRALQIRRDAAPYLANRNGPTQFDGWDDLRFVSPRLFGGETTARGRELFVGTQVGLASEDPAANRATLAALSAKGVRVVAPARTPEDLAAGRLLPGMPILDASSSVPLSMVSQRLSMDSLSRQFGKDLFAHHAELNERMGRGAPRSVRLSAQEFARKATRVQRRPSAERAVSEAFSVRQTIGPDGVERLRVVHRDRSEEAFQHGAVPAGRYRKEDDWGMPCGLIDVSDTGWTHLDGQGRRHNETGPAVVHFDNGARTDIYALAGETVSRERLFDRRSVEPTPGVAPRTPRAQAPAPRAQMSS